MNFGERMKGAVDAFKVGGEGRKGKELPFTYTDFFAEKNTKLEYLGLTWRQRMGCVGVCVVLSVGFFLKALFNMLKIATSPDRFSVPYAVGAAFCFVMLGFLSGFKTFFTGICSRDMAPYTALFIGATMVTIYSGSWARYVFKLPIALVEVVAFTLFMYTYFLRRFKSGGMKALSILPMFR